MSDAVDNCPVAFNPEQENCNAEAESASNARGTPTALLGDACDPVPCPYFEMPVTATSGSAAGQARCSPYNVNTGSICVGRIVRDMVALTPVSSHSDGVVASGKPPIDFPVPAVETDFRYCQTNLARHFDCSQASVLADVQLNNGVSAGTETKNAPALPWHRITIGSLKRDAVGDALVFDYGPQTKASLTWGYLDDNASWTASGMLPPPGDYKSCTDPSYGQGTCLDGRIWVHGSTPVGNTLNTVNGTLVGIHGSDLANHYVTVRPDDARSWNRPPLGVSGLQREIWIWQTLPDPGPDGDSQWTGIWQQREGVAVTTTEHNGAIAMIGGGASIDAAPLMSNAALHRFLTHASHWASAVEPGRALNESSALPIAVAYSLDGTTIADTVYMTSHGAVMGTETGATAKPGTGLAQIVQPAARKAFTTVYSRSAGGTFVVGGSDINSGATLGDAWFQPANGQWRQIPLQNGYRFGLVLAATYSFGDGRLWILNETADHQLGMLSVHLLRVDPLTGTVEDLASRPKFNVFDTSHLSVDKDGTILIASSRGGTGAAHLVGRIATIDGVLQASMGSLTPGQLLAAPFVDERGYGLVVVTEGEVMGTIRQNKVVTSRPGPLSVCGGRF